MEVAAPRERPVEQVRQVTPVAGEPALLLHEVEEEHAGQRRQGEGVAVTAWARASELVGEVRQRRAECAEEARGHAFAREGIADAQAERQRGFSGDRGQPLQRGEGPPGRAVEQDGPHPWRGVPRAVGAPGGADQPARVGAERDGEPALRSGGEALRGGMGGSLRIGGRERDDAEGLVPGDERDGANTRRFRRRGPEPGPGWHGLPRRLIAEHAK